MSEQPTPATTTPADPPTNGPPAPSVASSEEATSGTAEGPGADAAEQAQEDAETSGQAQEDAETSGQAQEDAETSGQAPPDAGAAEQPPPDAGQPAEEEPHVSEPSGDEAETVPPAERAQQGAAPDGPAATPRRRITAAGGILAVLLALLGFTVVAQVRSANTDPSLPAARQEELVRILADLDAHEQRLRQEIAEQEQTLQRLTTAGESRQEALEEATRRADELGVLAGILPVEGPGLTVEIRAGLEPISAARLLDAVQELRGAGAEAIELTDGAGTQVRVVASSYFVDADGGAVRVDGRLLRSPYTITAIGEPATLQPALAIPGGVVESVQSDGGTVTLHDHPDGVEITAVREPAPLKYASPVS